MLVRVRLAPGVLPEHGALRDPAMRRVIELADDASRFIALIATEGSAQLDEGDPRWPDLVELHDRGLVNVTVPFAAAMRLALDAVRTGRNSHPALAMFGSRRVEVRGTSFASIAGTTLWALARNATWVLAVFAILGLGMMMLMRQALPWLIALAVVPPALVILGLALHEAGHLYALRRVTGIADVGWLRLGVLCAGIRRPALSPRDTATVAAAGPATASATGVVIALAGVVLGSPAFVVCGLPLCAHLITLSPWASDGRSFLRALKEMRRAERARD
ncbi:MAG: hypothetical protein WBJ62_07545 [Coriobacteriia bacterium]